MAPGKTADLQGAWPASSAAKESQITWMIGKNKAATTGRTGNIKCANTSSAYSEDFGSGLLHPEQTKDVSSLLNHLILINPNITPARQHIHMRHRRPIRMRLRSIRIPKRQ